MPIIRDLAMVITAAWIAGFALWQFRQPLILGYVAAGLLLSPLTPGPRVHDIHTFEVMAEVGVLLLMFSIGIEFSIPDLLRVKWVALAGAPLGIALSVGLSTGAWLLLGLPFYQGVTVGCIVSVASTTVLVRFLVDRGELGSEAGRVMIALTLVEDLVVVILTVLMPGIGSSGPRLSSAFWTIGKATLILVPVLFAAWPIVPRVLARVQKTCNDELSVLLALAICLAVAGITEAAGLSLALGAFIGGMLLASSEFGHEFAEKTHPIRDAFVAFFFVTVGMLIDPAAVVTNWQFLLVMIGLILIGKFIIWFSVVRLFGFPARTALHVGIGLTQIGEFSFILAQAALHAGLITAAMYNTVLAASLITIIANATLFKLAPAAVARASAAD